MVLLAIRTLGQIGAIMSPIMITQITGVVMAVIYIGSLIGVFRKNKWGSIIAIIVAIIDILLAFSLFTGAFAFGAAAYDVIMMFLGYKEYKFREAS